MRTLLFLIIISLPVSNCSEDGFKDVNYFIDNKNIQTIDGSWKVISFEDFVKENVEFKNQKQ